MGALSGVTLGQVVAAAGRYKPVLAALAVLLVGLSVLPEPEGGVGTARSARAGGVTAGGPVVGGAPPEQPAGGEEGAPAGGPEGAFGPVAPAESTFAPVAPVRPVAGSGFGDGGGGSTTGGPPPAGDAGAGFAETGPESGAGQGIEPLRVVASAWATATAGTPFATEGVPPGSLPVGTRIGRPDKQSYVRLAGTATVLVLREDPAGSRQPPLGGAFVTACRVTEAWQPREGMTFDEAPAHDPAACVDGRRADDGTWTFDLAAVGPASGGFGFALVPGPDAAVDFQVALRAG